MPRGIDFAGSFRSPDIPTPERIPVTAGKNTARTCQKPGGSTGAAAAAASGACSGEPQKNDTSEKAIAAMTTYWLFSATDADSVAIRAMPPSVTRLTMRGSHPAATGTAWTNASVKPTT